MSNLIITIISIALVAITALLGLYYGGDAFTNYQYKIKAQQVLDGMQAIADGWTLYAADHGGNRALTDWQGGARPQDGPKTSADLVPQYLSQFPPVPIEFETYGNGGQDSYMFVSKIDNTHYALSGAAADTGAAVAIVVLAQGNAGIDRYKLCETYNKIVGADPPDSSATANDTLDTIMHGKKTVCIYSIFQSGVPYFLYRF